MNVLTLQVIRKKDNKVLKAIGIEDNNTIIQLSVPLNELSDKDIMDKSVSVYPEHNLAYICEAEAYHIIDIDMDNIMFKVIPVEVPDFYNV